MRLFAYILVACVFSAQATAQILFQVHREPWSIVQIGDIHAGHNPGSAGATTAALSNSISTIIANKATWNIKMVVSPGDCYEQVGDFGSADLFVTNLPPMLKRIQTNGVSFLNLPGNHDCDDASAIYFWTNQFPMTWYTNDPAFVSCRTNPDTRNLIFAQTNSGMKMLFLTYRWQGDQHGLDSDAEVCNAYLDENAWIKSTAAQYPNHHVIVLAHYFLNKEGQLALEDGLLYPHIGPGICAWTNSLDQITNMILGLCGHTRLTAHTFSTYRARDGQDIPFLKWNTQNAQTSGWGTNGTAFKLLTVIPGERRIHAQTYDTALGRFMTNGEWGYTHDFYIPIRVNQQP